MTVKYSLAPHAAGTGYVQLTATQSTEIPTRGKRYELIPEGTAHRLVELPAATVDGVGAKYELIPEGGLFRLKALRRVRDGVRAGTEGGLVAGPHSLSHEGTCWVTFDAQVLDHARVHGNALVGGSSVVRNSAEVTQNCQVYGRSDIRDTAVIFGSATVTDGIVEDRCTVGGVASIQGASLRGGLAVGGNAAMIEGVFGQPGGTMAINSGYFCHPHAKVEQFSDFLTLATRWGALTAFRTLLYRERGYVITIGCQKTSLTDLETFARRHGATRDEMALIPGFTMMLQARLALWGLTADDVADCDV